MPILSRTVLLGFQAAALIATVGQAPLATLAVPIPVPMPLMPHMADYASQPPFRNNTSIVPQTQVFSTSRRDLDAAVVDHTASYTSPIERRQDMGSVVPGLQEHSDNLQTMAAEPGDNKELLQGLSDSIMNLLAGVKTNPVLSDATASKGLANYDPNNDLETAIKEAINSIKSTLDEVVGLLDIDIAGIDLGGILWLVKCIIIAVLDALENFVDGAINYGVLEESRLELQELLKQVDNARCALGITVAALCFELGGV